jgi:hypothetical protein
MAKRISTILNDIYDDEVFEDIKDGEGTSYHIYLDTRGNVTVGTGRMLPNENTAANIPFSIPMGNQKVLATSHEIKEAFQKVKKLPFGQGYTSDYFDLIEKPRLVKNLTITKDDVDNLLTEDLTRSVRELKNKFPDFDEYL